MEETDNSACRLVGTSFVRTLRSGQSWDVAVREATKAVDTADKDRSGIAGRFEPESCQFATLNLFHNFKYTYHEFMIDDNIIWRVVGLFESERLESGITD